MKMEILLVSIMLLLIFMVGGWLSILGTVLGLGFGTVLVFGFNLLMEKFA